MIHSTLLSTHPDMASSTTAIALLVFIGSRSLTGTRFMTFLSAREAKSRRGGTGIGQAGKTRGEERESMSILLLGVNCG